MKDLMTRITLSVFLKNQLSELKRVNTPPKTENLLHSLNGREDIEEFGDDENTQNLKSVDGLTYEHQYISSCSLIGVSQKLNQL